MTTGYELDDGPLVSVVENLYPAPGLSRRSYRSREAATLAAQYDGVCNRGQLRRRGVTRDDIRHEVAAGRWKCRGNQTVEIYPGGPAADRWRAIWEVRGQPRLDGVSALQAAGLEGWTEATIHVSVPEGTKVIAVEGVIVHRVRHLTSAVGDPPRSATDWAALHAAAWAASDRSASTLLAMAVQQRLTTGQHLNVLVGSAARLRRIDHIRRVVADISNGAQALSELDFVQLCRSHRLPPPEQQSARRGHRGRIYLDAWWSRYNVAVEIDGSQHGSGLAYIDDALRDNELRHDGMTVLRIPALALHVEPGAFAEQIRRALRRGGWPG